MDLAIDTHCVSIAQALYFSTVTGVTKVAAAHASQLHASS
jgi:hypothetical protein